MLKLVLTGLWICGLTLGSVYFSMKMAAGPGPVDEAALKRESEEYIAGEMVTVPVLGAGAVQGYFLAKLSFAAEKDLLKNVKEPIKELVTDELYTLLIGNDLIDIRNTKTFDLDHFKSSVRDALNKRLNGEVIKTVLIEQLEYVSKEDTDPGGRATAQQKLVTVPIIDKNGEQAHDEVPASAVASEGSH